MATRSTSVGAGNRGHGIASVLSSAILEWLLLLLLFLDAFFSYMVTKFARLCELQTPCLFCSRLDHILGGGQAVFYRDLLCHFHKLEISKMVYCRAHEKLSNADGMCNSCISSFNTEKKFDSKGLKSHVTKLDPYIEYSVDIDHNIHLNYPVEIDEDSLEISFDGGELWKGTALESPRDHSLHLGLCSCCNEPLAKTFSQRMDKSTESKERNVSSLFVMQHGHLNHLDRLMKRRGELLGSASVPCFEPRGSAPLSPIEHDGIQFASDSESEVLTLDVERRGDTKQELMVQSSQMSGNINARITSEDAPLDLVSEKIAYGISLHETSYLDSSKEVQAGKFYDVASLSSSAAESNGLEEFKWDQDEFKAFPQSASTCVSSGPIALSDGAIEPLAEGTKEKVDDMVADDIVSKSAMENEELSHESFESIVKSSTLNLEQPVTNKEGMMSSPSCLDLNDAYELIVDSKANRPPATLTKLVSGKESTSISDDLKLLLSQISAVRGFELSWSNIGLCKNAHDDNSMTSDISSAIGLQILPKRISTERGESGFASLDESLLIENAGEVTIDLLRQRVHSDWLALNAMYKELEEERSASAIAANQAMAMINRLQEERAAMQMDALQYQRMMEEQAEYDQQALLKLSDQLADKEKEIKDMEEELETYRQRYSIDLEGEKVLEKMSDLRGNAFLENNTGCKITKMETLEVLNIKDEKAYILKYLKKLKDKLHVLQTDGARGLMSKLDMNSDVLRDEGFVDVTLCGFREKAHKHLTAEREMTNGFLLLSEYSGEGGIPEVYFSNATENVVSALAKQVRCLDARLNALEDDQNFLEHAVSSINSGSEALYYLQEIASCLQEMRMLEMGMREANMD